MFARQASHLRGIVLEREHAAAEIADAGGEPDRRVAARAADLEHLAVRLRRDQREEELPGRRRDLARAQLAARQASSRSRRPPLQAREHGADPVVEHRRT